MPILAYILIFIALGLIAYGLMIKGAGISKVPLYKPDPKIEVNEEQLVRFASKNITLIGIVDLIVAIGLMLTNENLEWDLIIFGITIVFTLFIFMSIKYASKVLIIPKV